MSSPISTTAWKTLLATPTPERPKAASAKSSAADKKIANLAMWAAIDKNQIRHLEAAIESGASINNRREGQPPLWRAVAGGQWEIADLLISHGADIHAKTLSHQSMFGALTGRDNPDEAERLLAWGCDPTETSGDQFLVLSGAPKLLEWWLERGNTGKIPTGKTDTNEVTFSWVRVAMNGSPKLRAMLNKAWGISGKDPNEFSSSTKRNEVSRLLWEAILQKDNVELARACLRSGWGMPNYANDEDRVSICWAMARTGAWHLLEWFRQVPEFKDKMMKDATNAPEASWWPTAKENLPSLERVLALGVDLHQENSKGQTIAHEALSSYGLKKPIVQWFATHHPEMLDQGDHEGKTPLQSIPNSETRSQMEALLMGRASPKAAATKTIGRRL